MTVMIHYLIQLLIFQALFLGIYELFLKKETFFSLNRVYLLATPFLAAIIPLLEFEILQNVVPTSEIVQLPVLFISENTSSATIFTNGDEASFSLLNFMKTNALATIYFLGSIISFAVFLRKYLQLQRLKYVGKSEKIGKTKLVHIPESRIACSFFNTIFLGENLSEAETSQILAHELAHVEQKHSWDLLLFEFFRIVLWFNPFIYRQQSQLSILHEYIADEKAVQKFDKKYYFQDLLNATFGTRQLSFTNQFFNKSFIKKRIMMLQKPKSNRNAKLKYLLVLPLLFMMLTYVACSEDQQIENNKNSTAVKTIKVESLCIDEEKEAEIVEIIQQIGNRYNKVIVTDGKQSLIFNQPRWKNGFIDQNAENLSFTADKFTGFVFPPSPSKPSYPPSPLDELGIPMAVIDQTPVFPGCESLSDHEAQKNCMSKKIREFVNANFDTGLAEKLELEGKQRIQVMFQINENGEVAEVKARAPHPELKEEAIRVVEMLPEMTPGKQDGKPVNVLYSLPIIFQVN